MTYDEARSSLGLSAVNVDAENPERSIQEVRILQAPRRRRRFTRQASIDRNDDFLDDPHPGVKADVKLDDIVLGYFEPVVRHYDVVLKGGLLSVAGAVEYAPTFKAVDLTGATIRDVRLDWVHTRPDKSPTAAAATTAQKATEKTADKSDLLVRLRELRIANSDLGVIDRAAKRYRVFLPARTPPSPTQHRRGGGRGGEAAASRGQRGKRGDGFRANRRARLRTPNPDREHD